MKTTGTQPSTPVSSAAGATYTVPDATTGSAPLDEAGQAQADNAFNALIDMMKHAHLSEDLYNQWMIVGNLENLATYAEAFSQLPAERLALAVQGALDVAKNFPDSEMGAVLGSAVLSGVLQSIEANPEMIEKLGPEIVADLEALALAIDQSGHIGFQDALTRADNLENWTRGPGTELSDFDSETPSGDVDFAKFPDADSAIDAYRSVVGTSSETLGAPPARADSPPPTAGSGARITADNLVERLMGNPRFAAIIALIEMGMQQKDAAHQFLDSSSGDLDERDMAIFTEANKEADQFIQTASNVQKSDNDIMDTLARNVG